MTNVPVNDDGGADIARVRSLKLEGYLLELIWSTFGRSSLQASIYQCETGPNLALSEDCHGSNPKSRSSWPVMGFDLDQAGA